MNTVNRKIAIYSRKSKFTGKGESIENQIELCKEYIKIHFCDVRNENILVFEDEGFSGGHLDRPKFKEMMELVKNKEISNIVCYRLDRISRNIGDFAVLIEELNNLDTGFISIKEQFDTSSPIGRAMMYIASVFSQLERETIAERIRDNMHELAKTGRWLGGTTPTGYKSEAIEKITIDKKIRKTYKLTMVDKEIELIKIIFDKFIETNSLTKTETYLIQNNYKSKNNKDFSRFAIRNILENPVYMIADKYSYEYFINNDVELFSDKKDFNGEFGIMAYNKTLQKHGKTHEIRKMKDWIVAVGKHKGIITAKDWIKVQSMLLQNKDKNYRKPRSNVALLSGVLFCKCGNYMRPKLTKRKNKKGENIYYYLCSMKERSRMQKCSINNLYGNMIDQIVCEEIKKLSENHDAFLKELNSLKRDFDYNKLCKNNTENEVINENKIQEFCDFAKIFDNVSVEQKRAILKTLISKVIWDGENVHIYLYGSEQKDDLLNPLCEYRK